MPPDGTRAPTRRSVLRSSAIAGGLALAPGSATAADDPERPDERFLVGAAKASMNPEPPFEDVCLGGYGAFCARPMESVRNDLFARALAVTGDAAGGPPANARGPPAGRPGRGPPEAETLIVVTATAAGLFAAYKEAVGPYGCQPIREGIAAETGVPAGNVLVQGDHSHAAPDTIGIWGGVPASFFERLHDAAVKAATAAFRSREACGLSVGTTEAPIESLYREPPGSATDDEFRVLFAERDGERVATFVNYSPHPTVLGGQHSGGASGDWPAWAADRVETRAGGTGVAAVGALGAQDWGRGKAGSSDRREANARARLDRALDGAYAARRPIEGSVVGVESTFVREQLAQPVLAGNLLPGAPGGPFADGELSIDRSITPPWLTGDTVGTVVSAARVGDLFVGTAPGEPFPEVFDAVRERVDAREHMLLGVTNDFLGYMTVDPETYAQVTRQGAGFLAGCPEETLLEAVDNPDPACPDHWTLMVSPTIGRHVVCSLRDGAASLGFDTDGEWPDCPVLTASDDVAAD
ncbi:hypothetical protein BRC90_04450 [Halobacteriales archaeon QS_4_69_34]|nr:MAG: hypothetical protein BRC90_04450 [Halobacteriales archaeon QS_4_69_34]